jgi:hypothetical protein
MYLCMSNNIRWRIRIVKFLIFLHYFVTLSMLGQSIFFNSLLLLLTAGKRTGRSVQGSQHFLRKCHWCSQCIYQYWNCHPGSPCSCRRCWKCCRECNRLVTRIRWTHRWIRSTLIWTAPDCTGYTRSGPAKSVATSGEGKKQCWGGATNEPEEWWRGQSHQ